MKDNDYI